MKKRKKKMKEIEVVQNSKTVRTNMKYLKRMTAS